VSQSAVWSELALKDAARLDELARHRVVAAVDRLAAIQRGDVKRLQERPGQLRLRVGDWRVVFRFIDEPEPGTVFVLRVHPRGRAYR